MSSTTKICSECGQDKPRTDFYVAHKATATRKAKIHSRCKDCMNTRKREVKVDQPRINRQRARNRAVADLIKFDEDEFATLYEIRLAEARDEAEELAQQPEAQEHYGTSGEPVRLRPGQRRNGQKPVDRIDVARCPHCIRHHDAGHACAVCGAAPGQNPSATGQEMSGTTRRAAVKNLDSRGKQASKVGKLPSPGKQASKSKSLASPGRNTSEIGRLNGSNGSHLSGEASKKQAACSGETPAESGDNLSDSPRRTRHSPRVYDGLGLPRKPPPGIDLAALDEFNAGVERARKAAHR